ncbi:DUF4870 domain-containing protein [Pseudobacter ginsenosidimutans]|uniref:Putative membrane protein n=1 Tax=Pseudobacter ginsenosidimutans TaxID=661488 RepID=A0A4Q7N1T7_9BACT|nr:DUF4870 domain-containing protein [Pseudobacter ginsenosidimutans]QEC43767.1 DUF4870 domain-containing protein [Pseudobacter ginsenosidimutans]RZS75182.1 putative membrane protein [Pseudobacter ginsenosidimutans]
MDRKTLSIVSYITLIGWLVAYFQYKDKPKDPLVSYHLRQSLGIAILSIILSVAITVVVRMVPALWVLTWAQIVILVLWILGILNAANEKMQPVPVVGPMFENKFSFLDK